MYGDRGLDDHPNPLINGQLILTVQNELYSDPNPPFELYSEFPLSLYTYTSCFGKN